MSDNEAFFDRVGAQRGNRDMMATRAYPPDAAQPISERQLAVGPSRSWAEGDGAFWGVPITHKTLPGGFYSMSLNPQVGAVFHVRRNDTDSLIVLPDSASEGLIEEIERFKTLKPAFAARGFLYKRGILMWGPPGGGKTTTLQLMVQNLMRSHDSIAVLVEHPEVAAACLQALRRIEPERQVVAILEDLDALIDRHGESQYLALLDGESQVDNVVYIATTNYPERLDARFVDRPSRFDTIRYIGMPNAEARRAYLLSKEPSLANGSLQAYVDGSDGFSVAHLRELIILTKCFEVSLPDALKRLRETQRNKPASDKQPDRAAFGFGIN